MSEIKALCKLLNCGAYSFTADERRVSNREIHEIADAIQGEVDSRFMELPCDADGVPIRVSDWLTYVDFKIQAAALSPERVYYWDDGGNMHWVNSAKHTRHYHAPTVDDVLYTYGQSCIRAHEEAESDDAKREMLASLRKEFEMKLREVMRNE